MTQHVAMRIGIDARAYDWTGIGRYARNILRELAASALQTPSLSLVVFVPRRFAREVSALPKTAVIPVRESYYSLYEQTGFLHTVRRQRVDLMHFLSFNVPVLYRRPFVVTIHDLTRFTFQGQKHHGWLHQRAYEAVFGSAIRHAAHVIAVSRWTALELLQRFPAVAGRLSVITEGVEEQFVPRPDAEADDGQVLESLGVRRPYLLYVGLWMRHKNLAVVLEAFRRIRDTGFPGTLVITGEGRAWDEDPSSMAASSGVRSSVVLPGRVSDAALVALYRRAEALLFPSLSEGFGLPPLEAMACGTPVITSSAGSLPEILGEAALFVDPRNPRELADAALVLLGDSDLRARLIRAGLERASRYTWRACATETAALYVRVLGQHVRERLLHSTRV